MGQIKVKNSLKFLKIEKDNNKENYDSKLELIETAKKYVENIKNDSNPLLIKKLQEKLKLLDELEDLDDVQKVYTNAEFNEEAGFLEQATNAAKGSIPNL